MQGVCGGDPPNTLQRHMSRTRIAWNEVIVLALVAVAALAFVYPINWQDVSRLGLTESIALRGSLRIDPYASQTGDKASFGGHIYSDKAPGMSFAALPTFEAMRVVGAVGSSEKEHGVWNRYVLLWLLRLASGGLLFLLAVWLVGRAAERVAPASGAVAMATFGLGTLALPLAATTFGHVGAGAVAFASFLSPGERVPGEVENAAAHLPPAHSRA